MKTYRAPPRSQGSTAVDKRKVQLSEQTVKTTKTQQAYRYRCRGELEDGEEDDEEDGVVVAHNEEEDKEDGLPEAEKEDREKDMPEEDVLEEYG